MIDFAVATEARTRAADRLADAGIVLTADEEAAIEIADFGMGDLPRYGLEVLVYVNNDRYCAKDLVLFPHQICPEHRHPPVGDDPGKQETFRVRVGVVYLYVEGDPTAGSDRLIPPGDDPPLHRPPRDCPASRRPAHDRPQYPPLVRGRRGRRDSLRVLQYEPRRVRPLHRPPRPTGAVSLHGLKG